MKRAAAIHILLAAIAATVSAQFFVEGSFRSLSTRFHSNRFSFLNTYEEPPSIYFKISPIAGYQLNDKMAVGAKASLIREKEITTVTDLGGNYVEIERRQPEWNFAVFGRYKMLGAKKIYFLVETSVYISEKRMINNNLFELTGRSDLDQTTTTIGLNMTPLLTYQLNGKLSFVAAAEFLSLDLSSQTENTENGWEIKRKNFGFTGKSEFYSYLLFVRIGFIYHFKPSSQ